MSKSTRNILSGIIMVVAFCYIFRAPTVAEKNIKAITSDLLNLAARAQQFYYKPVGLGGGGNSFSGLSADASGINKLILKTTNDNGTYSIITAGNATSVTLQGLGNQDGDGDATNCTVRITVFADSLATTVVNR